MSYNPRIGLEALRVIANDLLDNPVYKRIDTLQLEGCNLKDEGAKLIADATEYNLSIKFLNLSRNEISAVGAVPLAKMISNDATLSVLFLYWNPLKAEGAKIIAESLINNTKLKILDLSFCSMGNS